MQGQTNELRTVVYGARAGAPLHCPRNSHCASIPWLDGSRRSCRASRAALASPAAARSGSGTTRAATSQYSDLPPPPATCRSRTSCRGRARDAPRHAGPNAPRRPRPHRPPTARLRRSVTALGAEDRRPRARGAGARRPRPTVPPRTRPSRRGSPPRKPRTAAAPGPRCARSTAASASVRATRRGEREILDDKQRADEIAPRARRSSLRTASSRRCRGGALAPGARACLLRIDRRAAGRPRPGRRRRAPRRRCARRPQMPILRLARGRAPDGASSRPLRVQRIEQRSPRARRSPSVSTARPRAVGDRDAQTRRRLAQRGP